jgi:hypothetical protein
MRDNLKKKKVQDGKQADLEKGDFLAILIAAASVFIPVILGVLLFIFVIIKALGIFFR